MSLILQKLITLYINVINYSNMAIVNRIKVVLVEKGKTGKWLAKTCNVVSCIATVFSQTQSTWIR